MMSETPSRLPMWLAILLASAMLANAKSQSITNTNETENFYMSASDAPEVAEYVKEMNKSVEEFVTILKNRKSAMKATFIPDDVMFDSEGNAVFSTVIDTHRTMKKATQNVEQTRQALERNGPVNNNVDVISVVSTTEINNIFAQKKLSKFTKFQHVLKNLPLDHPESEYRVKLNIGQPVFYFSDGRNELAMAFHFGEGSELTWVPGWNPDGQQTFSLSKTHATCKIGLQIVEGKVDGSYVTLRAKETKVNMVLGGNVKDIVRVSLAKAFESFFKKTFIEKDYILGKVVMDPSKGAPSVHMQPKRFKMKVVPDYNNPLHGTGFLVFFIQTSSNRELEERHLHVPNTFNLLPDQYTSGLIITNYHLHNAVLPFKASSDYFTFGPRKVEGDKAHPYYETTARTVKTRFSSMKELYCEEESRQIIGRDGVIYEESCETKTRTGSYSVESNNMKVTNDGNKALKLTMDLKYNAGDCEMDKTAWFGGGTTVSKCETLSNMVTIRAETSYEITLSDEKIIITNKDKVAYETKQDATYGDKSYCLWKGPSPTLCINYSKQMNKKIKQAADENFDTVKKASWTPSPTFDPINTFSVNRIFFTDENIYKFENVQLTRDLIVWGETKSSS